MLDALVSTLSVTMITDRELLRANHGAYSQVPNPSACTLESDPNAESIVSGRPVS